MFLIQARKINTSIPSDTIAAYSTLWKYLLAVEKILVFLIPGDHQKWIKMVDSIYYITIAFHCSKIHVGACSKNMRNRLCVTIYCQPISSDFIIAWPNWRQEEDLTSSVGKTETLIAEWKDFLSRSNLKWLASICVGPSIMLRYSHDVNSAQISVVKLDIS